MLVDDDDSADLEDQAGERVVVLVHEGTSSLELVELGLRKTRRVATVVGVVDRLVAVHVVVALDDVVENQRRTRALCGGSNGVEVIVAGTIVGASVLRHLVLRIVGVVGRKVLQKIVVRPCFDVLETHQVAERRGTGDLSRSLGVGLRRVGRVIDATAGREDGERRDDDPNEQRARTHANQSSFKR